VVKMDFAVRVSREPADHHQVGAGELVVVERRKDAFTRSAFRAHSGFGLIRCNSAATLWRRVSPIRVARG
jgi:hypothetical protein